MIPGIESCKSIFFGVEGGGGVGGLPIQERSFDPLTLAQDFACRLPLGTNLACADITAQANKLCLERSKKGLSSKE